MRIRNVRCQLLTAPVPAQQQFTSDLGTVQAFHAAIVIVETDEGITGYGEAKGTPAAMKGLVELELKPLLVGEDPTRVQYLWEKMVSGTRLGLALFYGRAQTIPLATGDLMCAISGIDIALWDLAGKALGVPVYKLLGGPLRTRIQAYASGGHAPVEGIGEQFLGYVAKGFRGCKMRVGGKDHPRMVAGSAARVRAAREALGPEVMIMLDAHGSMSVSDAVKLARAVEEYDVAWFEEPVIYHDYLGLAEVRRASGVPVATGENLYSRVAFRDLGLARAADVWQPDIAMAGGITEGLRIAALASSMQFQLAPHVWGSALLWAASLQLAATVPNYFLFEFGQTYNPLLYELLAAPSVKVEQDGYVEVPQGPGLGVELRPDFAERYPFDPGLGERKPLF